MKRFAPSSLIPARTAAAAIFFLAGSGGLPADENSAGKKPFPETSPEHQALSAATPYLGNDAFTLRNDYWKGKITTRQGTALRLQFFKGNTYRLFFGVGTENLPKSARLHLHLFNSREKEVSTVAGEPGQAAVVLNFEKNRKTDLYLVLMRIEAPPGPVAEVALPAVLFYGWE